MPTIAFYIAVALALLLAYWIISEKRKETGAWRGKENIFRPEEDTVSPEQVKAMWFIPQRVRTAKPSTIPLITKATNARGRKPAPVKGACALCEKQVTMPFKCKFCGGLYCDEHRLPESHNCSGLGRLRREQKRAA